MWNKNVLIWGGSNLYSASEGMRQEREKGKQIAITPKQKLIKKQPVELQE